MEEATVRAMEKVKTTDDTDRHDMTDDDGVGVCCDADH
jgi:hypothetical protein